MAFCFFTALLSALPIAVESPKAASRQGVTFFCCQLEAALCLLAALLHAMPSDAWAGKLVLHAKATLSPSC